LELEKSRVDQRIIENKDKNLYDLFVLENLVSTRRRRELGILTCFNLRDRKNVHRKTINNNKNKIKNVSQVLANTSNQMWFIQAQCNLYIGCPDHITTLLMIDTKFL